MDIIVFGASSLGKGAISYLKKKYKILFFVDNDKKKFVEIFEGYVIKSPDNIKDYNCNIIITSTYYCEISRQLLDMGIDKNNIYICHRYKEGIDYIYEEYPLIAENLKTVNKPLKYFDIKEKEEEFSRNIKILIFSITYSIYTKQLIENMAKRYGNLEFSLVTRDEKNAEVIISDSLKHIYKYKTYSDLKTILEGLPDYDIMQLLWIEQDWAYFYKLIRKKAKKLNLNVGGSDFYRARKDEKEFKRNLVKCADCVTAENIETVNVFQEYYGSDVSKKMGILPFGIEVLDYIDKYENFSKDIIKENFRVQKNKLIVTCGHNANEMHQHMEIINSISKVSQKVKENVLFVFPMTYPEGKCDYIEKVKKRLNELKLDYIVLTEFMDFKDMAKYALISDIMVHVQTTDQLSSTMLEEMYAGSIVIAGKWLPYASLHEKGIYFIDVHSISEVTTVLEDIINNFNQHKLESIKNRRLIYEHSSWDIISKKWIKIWE